MRAQTRATTALRDAGIRECTAQSRLAPVELLNLTGGQALVGRTLGEVERNLILDTLGHYAGNRTHAANVLGISIRTLRNKLHTYAAAGLPIPPPGLQMGRSREGQGQPVATAADRQGGGSTCEPPLSLNAHAPD